MKKPAKRSPCAIIVLGMHRSGTSALMRMVNLRGVDLGSNLMPSAPNFNEKGFWEHMDIYRLNEELLEDLNSSWDDVCSLPEGWWESEATQRYKLEVINILERDFAKSRFWGVKDPRICRFLPVWRPLLEQIGCKPYFLIIVRNPLEVVSSLAKRDGFSQGKSCLLWLKHIIESEKGTRNTPRLFVTYEELLSDWKGLMSRAQKSFQFKWPVALKDASPEIASFLQKSLRHNIVNDTVLIEDYTLSRWIKDLYFETKEAINGDDSQLIKTVTAIDAQLKDAASLYEPAVAEIWARYQANHVMLQERNQQLDDIKMRLDGSSQDKGYHLSTIDNLQTANKEKKERIQQLDAEMVELRNQLSMVQQTVVRREAEVSHLQTGINEKNEHIQQLDDELTGLRGQFAVSQKALSAHEACISDLQYKVKERDGRIHDLDIELVGLREEFLTLQGTADDRKDEITHFQADLEDRDDHIKHLDAESADLRKELTASQEVVAEYGSKFNQLKTEMKERDERIQQLDIELSGLREKNAASQEALSAREIEVKNLNIGIVEKDERIQKLDADVGRLQDEVDAMRTQVENRRLDLVAISGSKSWKLTSPLRWVYAKVRKVKGKRKTIRYLLNRQFLYLLNRQYRLINKSGLFDAAYYLDQNSDIAESGMNPLFHYLSFGAGEGRDPNPLFDTSYYLEQNPDIAESGMNPLAHYISFGAGEGRDPSPLFETSYYLEQNPEVAESGMNPLVHYRLEKGLISVIIPNYNGHHHLTYCLPSLLNTNGVEIEVIVADNGSTDASVNWLGENFPQVRVLSLNRNCGFGEANRRAVEIAEGEYIAFLNNDTAVDPDWLKVLLRSLSEDREVAATCATLKLLDYPDLINARGGGMTWLGYGFDRDFLLPYNDVEQGLDAARSNETIFPTAAAMLMRKKDFESFGGFDRAFFMYHEDVDLGWRLWLLGKRVLVCADAIVYHRFGGSSRAEQGLSLRDRLGMRHSVRSLLKHYGVRNLLRALKELIRLWIRNRAFGQMVYILGWNFLHLPGTLLQRRWVQRRKVRRNDELFRRGLISDALFPPPSPKPPCADPAWGAKSWIISPILLPGEHSAMGRLGYGWYARERDVNNWVRFTCGQAKCFLKIKPNMSGVLGVWAKLDPPAGEKRIVKLRCNGFKTLHHFRGAEWEEISLPVQADAQGILIVHIFSSAWVPHYFLKNMDFRKLGCIVKEICFNPDESLEKTRYQTASVVIPTFNRWKILRETLLALERQSWRDFEVIVVDDGSTDETQVRLQQWKEEHRTTIELKILRQKNAGPASARNHALRYASGDLIMFLGDDIIADPTWVETHIERHNQLGEECAVLGFTDWDRKAMNVTPFLEFINSDGQQFGYGHLRDGDDVPFTCFYTSNISIPRTVLGDEPFEPSFKIAAWEDTELGLRLSRRGLRILYHRQALARHRHPMTMTGFLRRQGKVGAAMHTLFALHPDLKSNDALPSVKPPKWLCFYHFRFVLSWSIPALNLLDQRKIALPSRLYRNLIEYAFFTGKDQG